MMSFVLLAIAGLASSLPVQQDLVKSLELCDELCSKCGGFAVLTDKTCYCSVLNKDAKTSNCLEDAEDRVKESELGLLWRTLVNGKRPSTDSEEDPPKRRAKRQMQPYSSYYSYCRPPLTPITPLQPYGQNTPPQIYELAIGNSGEDETLQLVFPHSNGIDIQHQYYLRDLDGSEHALPGKWLKMAKDAIEETDWSSEYEKDDINDDEVGRSRDQ